MTDKEKTIKELKEALDSLDITNKYRLNLIRAIEYLQEEPVSEDLEDAAIQICQKVLKGETIVIDGYEYVVLSDAEECFKAGAKWQKQQIMKDAVDACVTDIRIYKEENEVDFTVMYEKGIIPYEIEQEVKVIVIK